MECEGDMWTLSEAQRGITWHSANGRGLMIDRE